MPTVFTLSFFVPLLYATVFGCGEGAVGSMEISSWPSVPSMFVLPCHTVKYYSSMRFCTTNLEVFFLFFLRDTDLQIKDETAGGLRKAVGGSERERERERERAFCGNMQHSFSLPHGVLIPYGAIKEEKSEERGRNFFFGASKQHEPGT